MTPIDPVEIVPAHLKSSMAPPYVDENDTLESVLDGVEVADDELRDAVTDEYEELAEEGSEVEETLDDIDHDVETAIDSSPEIRAMHILREGEDIERTGE